MAFLWPDFEKGTYSLSSKYQLTRIGSYDTLARWGVRVEESIIINDARK